MTFLDKTFVFANSFKNEVTLWSNSTSVNWSKYVHEQTYLFNSKMIKKILCFLTFEEGKIVTKLLPFLLLPKNFLSKTLDKFDYE